MLLLFVAVVLGLGVARIVSRGQQQSALRLANGFDEFRINAASEIYGLVKLRHIWIFIYYFAR